MLCNQPSPQHCSAQQHQAGCIPDEEDCTHFQPLVPNCRYVASGPLVRSSYKAGEFFIEAMLDQKDRSAEADSLNGQ